MGRSSSESLVSLLSLSEFMPGIEETGIVGGVKGELCEWEVGRVGRR